MSKQSSALARSLETAGELKPGTWDPVKALSILTAAQATASLLKSGSWEAVTALAWLSRAERELANAGQALD